MQLRCSHDNDGLAVMGKHLELIYPGECLNNYFVLFVKLGLKGEQEN